MRSKVRTFNLVQVPTPGRFRNAARAPVCSRSHEPHQKHPEASQVPSAMPTTLAPSGSSYLTSGKATPHGMPEKCKVAQVAVRSRRGTSQDGDSENCKLTASSHQTRIAVLVLRIGTKQHERVDHDTERRNTVRMSHAGLPMKCIGLSMYHLNPELYI